MISALALLGAVGSTLVAAYHWAGRLGILGEATRQKQNHDLWVEGRRHLCTVGDNAGARPAPTQGRLDITETGEI